MMFISLHRHESSSGYYRVSVYFLSKSVTDLMIMRMIPLTVFSAITYFMIGVYCVCV